METDTGSQRNLTHPLVNTLVQLQELLLIRSEQKASDSEKYVSQLDESIAALLDKIPPDTRALFQKIQKKEVLSIVPISNNVCLGCGLTLPISLVYAVRAGQKLYQCTHCSRILYFPEVRPRRVNNTKSSRSEPAQIGIARFSSRSLMMPNMEPNNRDDVIHLLAMKMEDEGFVDDGANLLKEALAREAVMNTAVDHGIAFPHVRGVEGGGLTLALGTSRKGISFDRSSRLLTHIIFFIVIPTPASVFYLRLLAGLTQIFSNKEARQRLLGANTPDELWAALIKATRLTIK